MSFLEPISKIGFWFKIAAGPSFSSIAGFRIYFITLRGVACVAGFRIDFIISLVRSQTGGILLYVEDLKRGTNKDIGPKDIFEMGSINLLSKT